MKKLLFFNATWCGPCRAMKPVVQELESAGLSVEYINVEKGGVHVERPEYEIKALPTFVILDGDKEVARAAGMMPKPKLEELVNK